MATYTLKDIPDDLYSLLKQRAAKNHRSVNGELLVCIERSLRGRRVDAARFLARADAVRERLQLPPYTQRALNRAKKRGRH